MAQWHYLCDGKEVGPLNDKAICHLLAKGRLTLDALVRREDWTDWRPLREVRELVRDPVSPSLPAVPILDYESRTDPYTPESRFHATVSGLAAILGIAFLAAPSFGSSWQIGSALMAFGAGLKALAVMRSEGTSRDRPLALAGTLGGIIGIVARIVLWCIHYFR